MESDIKITEHGKIISLFTIDHRSKVVTLHYSNNQVYHLTLDNLDPK